MALHTELPIHRTGVRLLDLAIKAQVQMPRTVKRALGEKITQHCVDMLDLMALANATQRDTRAEYIEQLLAKERAITVLLRVSHDARYISPKLWADSIELLGSIGKQAGGPLEDCHGVVAGPTSAAEDAMLGNMFRAWHALRGLGWLEMFGYPDDGTVVEVITAGSTGVHDAKVMNGSWWVLFANDLWPAHPMLWRPKRPAD